MPDFFKRHRPVLSKKVLYERIIVVHKNRKVNSYFSRVESSDFSCIIHKFQQNEFFRFCKLKFVACLQSRKKSSSNTGETTGREKRNCCASFLLVYLQVCLLQEE